MKYPYNDLKFVWRQLEFAFFGALTSVGALFILPKIFFKRKEKKMNRKPLYIFLLTVLIACVLAACNTAPNFSAKESTQEGSIQSECETQTEVPQPMTAEEIYDLISPSVVEIQAEGDLTSSSGTGFFIDSDIIATNYHVIEDCTSATIILHDGSKHTVEKILGYNQEKDIALLSVSYDNGIPLTFRNSKIKTGETVFAIGNSLGFLGGSLSDGIVSTAERKIDNHTYIQTTASVTHGNSGGPLVDQFGEVIGIISAGFGNGLDLNLAIPISEIATISTSFPTTLNELFHVCKSPTFEWVEKETGYSVTAKFNCSCGNRKQLSTFVSSSSGDFEQIGEAYCGAIFVYTYTADVIYEGKTYSDTRYTRYKEDIIQLNRSNYSKYLNINCSAGGRTATASISEKKSENETWFFSDVVVKLTMEITGNTHPGPYTSGLQAIPTSYSYNITLPLDDPYISASLDKYLYNTKCNYSITSVSGIVVNLVMTDYLSSK